MGRTVVFVCAHGAARSRIAAAWFNTDPPPGWYATTTAGEDPAEAVNPRLGPLLAGTSARAHLDDTAPRPYPAGADSDLVIAIDCTVPGARRWNLTATEVDEAMRDELRDRVTVLTQALHAGAVRDVHGHHPG
jgi:protein-tyrosine-phosphatase